MNVLRRHTHGIALVAVIMVLTILALIAAVFCIYMAQEQTLGSMQMRHVQADLLAQSALQHVLSQLRDDIHNSPALDAENELWATSFAPDSSEQLANTVIDPAINRGGPDARWIPVKNEQDVVVGRYAVLIEDEARKINVNVASALSGNMQDEGISTYEIMLTDGKRAGLPLSLDFGKLIMAHRYGRDLEPGQAETDDNLTDSTYSSDLIDNDGDGLVDELNEGIDEPEEYLPRMPVWDDHVFTTINELGSRFATRSTLSHAAMRMLKKIGTTYSRSNDTYWDSRAGEWRRHLNLNAANKKQVMHILKRANEEAQFEPNSRYLRGMGSNIIDYRDENHVLSTIGNEYGVEAVCFNELMANDGSFTIRADRNTPTSSGVEVQRFGWWYELYHLQKEMKSYQWGWSIDSIGSRRGSAKVIENGKETTVPYTVTVRLDTTPRLGSDNERTAFNEFKSLMNRHGRWEKDQWKNAWLMVYKHRTNTYDNYYIPYPIVGNTDNELTVGCYGSTKENSYEFLRGVLSSTTNSVVINNLWRKTPGGLYTVFPNVTESFMFSVDRFDNFKMPDNLYYVVYIGENNLPGSMIKGNDFDDRETYTHVFQVWEKKLKSHQTPYKGFTPVLDVDGNPAEQSATRMMELTLNDLKGTSLQLPGGVDRSWLLRTPYKDGEPIQAKDGMIRLTISSTDNTGYGSSYGRIQEKTAYENKNVIQSFHCMRPDIIELINISDHPISLANWRVVINTGSYADQVGIIRNARHYSRQRGMMFTNPNPAIRPGEYFYLTNYRNIFDLEYGAPADGEWGNSAQEAYPCFELPEALWGVRYEVEAIKQGNKIVCKGANWRRNQMKYEMCEWHLRSPREDQNAPFGLRRTIESNTRRALNMGSVNIISLKKGDDVIIIGMPRSGGFLSMTMKNEYDQITARTIEYASSQPDEINYSCVKYDPTRYTWLKSPRPTFGGTKARAINAAARNTGYNAPHVKNSRLASIGEIQKIRKSEDWKNIGMDKGGKGTTRTLKALSRYCTTSGIRLDPEEPGVHQGGWRPAFGECEYDSVNVLSVGGNVWEPAIWNDQRVRILSGPLKGEVFAVVSNTQNSVFVKGYSVPGGKQLTVSKGIRFSIGPGYSTPFYYSRDAGEEGIWEWRNKGLEQSYYGLYIFGLNDSIKTTEFLEENHNAELEIAVYNYTTREFDILPLEGQRSPHGADPYHFISDIARHQYEKSDCIFCGSIRPQHISPSGGVRLKLVPHSMNHPDCSGFAWFDYAYLTPGIIQGKININTAPERVLMALNGITPEIAKHVRNRKLAGSDDRLPCYSHISDLLDIEGITPEIYSRICNLITTRSDQFRVQVLAQSVIDRDENGIIDEQNGDQVTGSKLIEAIIDRQTFTDVNPERGEFRMWRAD